MCVLSIIDVARRAVVVGGGVEGGRRKEGGRRGERQGEGGPMWGQLAWEVRSSSIHGVHTTVTQCVFCTYIMT
jgi:hypothetical protein